MARYLTNINLNKSELQNAKIHNVGVLPTPATGGDYGLIQYRTSDNTLQVWNGTAWQQIATGTVVTDATTTTKGIVQLTNDLSGSATAPIVVRVSSLINGSAAGPAVRFTSEPSTGMYSPSTGQIAFSSSGTTRVTISGAGLDLNAIPIRGMADPSGPQDAATKYYVDNTVSSITSGLHWTSVRAASTGDLNLANLDPGATHALTVDGVSLRDNDRVLLKDQATPAQNGIYVFTGFGGAPTLTRASDMNTFDEVDGKVVVVEDGTQAGTFWVTTSEVTTMGTDPINWVQFGDANALLAGNGLTKTGNTLNVLGTANRIVTTADTVDIASNYVGQTSITTLGTITTGTWNGGTIPVAYGGTAATSSIVARTNLGAMGLYTAVMTTGAGTTLSIPNTTHSLRPSRGIIVQVQDETTGEVVYPDASVASNGDVTVSFAVTQGATNWRVTLAG